MRRTTYFFSNLYFGENPVPPVCAFGKNPLPSVCALNTLLNLIRPLHVAH